ncbi:ATP-binding protein [Elusimicrobiota bacterium]
MRRKNKRVKLRSSKRVKPAVRGAQRALRPNPILNSPAHNINKELPGARSFPGGQVKYFGDEGQLRHMQKMEALGRMAGGIAHDFNNVLTAIFGSCEHLRDEMSPGGKGHDDIDEIIAAGEYAASLTQQLLAFTRKQVVQPVIFDVNGAISGMSKMLQRLIGEDIEFRMDFKEAQCFARADIGHMKQIIMNMALNARDAMGKRGKLTIKTSRVTLKKMFRGYDLELKPGTYAELSIIDNGKGMSAHVKKRIFEPFFTTKDSSRNTGLGLSMVYGTVKHLGGGIVVTSKPGKGTVFNILLPRAGKQIGKTPSRANTRAHQAREGAETVILAEDNKMVRKVACRILTASGYSVLEAANAGEALCVLKKSPTPVSLLITNVVMPGMGGIELARKISEKKPRIKVLFMSGYAPDTIPDAAKIDLTGNFLKKPFTSQELREKVSNILGGHFNPVQRRQA